MNIKNLLIIAFGLFLAVAGFFYIKNQKPSTPDIDNSVTKIATEKKNDKSSSQEKIATANLLNEQFTLDGSKDYSSLKAYYEPLAKKGDSHALRIIAQIYEYCINYSLSPKKFEGGLDALAKARPDNAKKLQQIKKITSERCSKLDNGLPITLGLVDLSWREALAANDSLATIRVAAREEKDGTKLDSLIRDALLTKEPTTIFEIGTTLSLNNSSKEFSQISGGGIQEYAWQVVACRRGGTSMCGAGSNLMSGLCMNTGACNYTSYEDAIRNGFIGRSEQPLLDEAIRNIETNIKN